MKKFFIAALALVGMSTSAMAFGYDIEDGITTQVFAGITTSSISGINNLDSRGLDYGNRIGGTIGAKLEYMLPGAYGTYVNAGLSWKLKGAKAEYTSSYSEDAGNVASIQHNGVTTTQKIGLNYIELPIHVGFRYNLSQTIGVYGEIGPYFAIGLLGKNKKSLSADGSWVEQYEGSYRAFKSSKSELTFQRWDAGFGFRIGAEYDNRYSVNLGCDWGITDMYRDSFRDAFYDSNKGELDKAHNFCLDITLGYRF